MKKTLIALAVAASAAVSGSAMAWTANGTGGSVDLSGTLTPVTKATPWEVKVGDAVTGLDAQIQKGQKEVSISVKNAIPVLGIRNADENGFKGREGIKPQIDYKGAVNIDGFKNGVTTVSMEVRGESGDKIGSLEAPFSAAALSSWNSNGTGSRALYASSSDYSFYGGLGKNSGAVRTSGSYELIKALSSEFLEKWKKQGDYSSSSQNEKFDVTAANYWGAYGSGIEKGQTIKITLDQAASGDAPIKWNAALPVTVTYM
ncbi:hypothetical protein NFK54_10305 [Escherichia marmotae]|uniref:F4 family fimbrial subunit n=1 Tax=Escherichia marmotae TaxID=1499973 RepID=UPI002433E952|nr:hypothetical protein [Escherichia marmotae]WFZ16613.1 hypothetical protein NFK54_10305 [Escherichia marmotae]HDP1444368.1 hypothetical protein [Escherichia coli]